MEEDLYGLHYGRDHQARLMTTHHQPPPPPAADSGGCNIYHHQYDHEGFPVSTAFGVPFGSSGQWMMQPGGSSAVSDAASDMVEDSMSVAVARARIAAHPLYPKLLQAYIDCQKVGAPAEVTDILDKIRPESEVCNGTVNYCLGSDPELDEFMEAYCDTLMRYKSDLSGPFEEATVFLKKVETQLNTLCNVPDDHQYYGAGNSSEEDGLSLGDIDGSVGSESQHRTFEDRELMDQLMLKYSGYIGTLKHEFSKKKKRVKLSKEARDVLLDWWNIHYKWPYPTEVDKVVLAESTGLDQKQINNWFINQRKRHWKPSDNMHLSLMESLYGPFFPP